MANTKKKSNHNPKSSRRTNKKTVSKKSAGQESFKNQLFVADQVTAVEERRGFSFLPKNRTPWPNSKNRQPIPNVFKLVDNMLKTLFHSWSLFLGITLIYGVMNFIFVHSLAVTNVSQLKASLEPTATTTVTGDIATFTSLLTGSGSSTNTNNAYQAVLFLLISVVLIWTLRQVYSGVKLRIKDSFYKGVSSLIPFTLVIVVIAIELIPLIVGADIYATVTTSTIAVGVLPHILWGFLSLVLAVISLYMLCSSLFALYIVTLPDMTPMTALRSARQLVRGRRLVVIRKLLFLPLVLVVVSGIIVLPFILLSPGLAGWVYVVISMFGLTVIHAYMYNLYREMLN